MTNENLAYKNPPVTELIEGKVYLISPQPLVQHNYVVTNIGRIFATYLLGKTWLALVSTSPKRITTSPTP